MDVVWGLAAYLLGAVPFTQLVAVWRKPGTDLRTVGSGTVSATGLYRVAGFWPLALGGVLDVAKGAAAATFARGDPGLGMLTAAAVVTGHCWSPFLRGAGGRGVSPAMGALAVLAWPGAVVLVAGLSFGRLVRQTGLGVFVADLSLVVVLGAVRGPAGAGLGAAVVVPMLLKRLTGNERVVDAGLRPYVWRLLYDADPPRGEGAARFDAATLEAVIRLLARRLDEHRDDLNRLNVYPVPDGDTGDNLVMTVRSISEHLPGTSEWESLTTGVARGALLGGRGSSGVILGQALRGFVQSIPEGCGAEGLASALAVAATSARAAVADPAEGTILTVAHDAAQQAQAATSASARLADVACAAAAEARLSLARTPELLPVLAQAGVVDAGGLGYVLFLDAVVEAVTGVAGPPPDLPRFGQPVAPRVGEPPDVDGGGPHFEVMCLLEADDDAVLTLRARWTSLGDTVAIAGGGGTWRCHLHTDDVAGALETAHAAGEVSDVDITDLSEQSAEESGLRAGKTADGRLSVVAVAEGEGLVAGYLEAGAHRVVVGGVTSKPSIGQLLRVIEACNGPVVLLAGDKDVVPAAERALDLATVPAVLVPADMVAGLVALRAVAGDSFVDPARLDAVARGVRTLRVQRAVRDSRTDIGQVHVGDWLAMAAGEPVAVGPTPEAALLDAVDAIIPPTATSGLLAVDLEASSGDGVVTRLEQAYPHIRWRVLRSNRHASAYGLAVT